VSALPSQGSLVLPLLEEIQAAGGALRTPEAYDALAERFDLSPAERAATVPIGGTRRVNDFAHRVRWAQQKAKLRGYVRGPEDGVWALTAQGADALQPAPRGTVCVVFETALGTMLWGDLHDTAGVVLDDSVNLLFTSLPYPLLTRKPYANQHPEKEHVRWALGFAEAWKPKLAEDGSMVLDLGEVWREGIPAQSLYIERLAVALADELGLFKCQTFYWHNRAKLPGPAEWVCVRRERVTPTVEPCLWFSKTPHPKASNTRVLRPYSPAMERRIASGGDRAGVRPSGHRLAAGAFARRNRGSIPGTLLDIPNTDSGSYYLRACRDAGIPAHPARFPEALPAWFIEFLTDVGDLVVDPASGSGKTARAAERAGRRWLAGELGLTYVRGSAFEFCDVQDLRLHLPDMLRGAPPRQIELALA
jgi:site-specific DNA-methyltransferase (cytosine-N4-specific)